MQQAWASILTPKGLVKRSLICRAPMLLPTVRCFWPLPRMAQHWHDCAQALAPHVGEIKRLYVTPDGRGLGLGKALVTAVLDQARRIGYREIKLDTLPQM